MMLKYKCTCWSENTTLTLKSPKIEPQTPSIEDFWTINDMITTTQCIIHTYIFKCKVCDYTTEVSR